MSFTPYLHFQGNCAEAMKFYAEVFGGKLTILLYSEMPDAPPDLAKSPLVMNAVLTAAMGMMMASDYPPGIDGAPQTSVTINHFEPDAPAAKAVFDRLMQGGEEIMAFAPTFWSPGFGMGKDRFGTHWMISVPGAM